MKNKISEFRLRQIILEELIEHYVVQREFWADLKEAPLADITEPGEPKFVSSGSSQDVKSVQKFFSGKKFRDDAVKYYDRLSLPIYVVPTFNPNNINRSSFFEPNKAATILSQRAQLSDEKIVEIEHALDAGATCWIVCALKLTKNFLPTPWMIIHAMFDNERSNVFQKIAPNCLENCKELFNILGPRQIHNALTMASARNKKVYGYRDIYAEIMCQAILTKDGFRYNQIKGSDPIAEKANLCLDQIKIDVSSARKNFESIVSGKLVAVDVSVS